MWSGRLNRLGGTNRSSTRTVSMRVSVGAGLGGGGILGGSPRNPRISIPLGTPHHNIIVNACDYKRRWQVNTGQRTYNSILFHIDQFSPISEVICVSLRIAKAKITLPWVVHIKATTSHWWKSVTLTRSAQRTYTNQNIKCMNKQL